MGSSSVDGLMMPPPRKMPRSGTRTDRSQGSSPRRSDASLCSDVEISFTQDERADDITWGQTSVPGQLAPANEFTVEEDESAISEEIAGIFGSLAAPGRAGVQKNPSIAACWIGAYVPHAWLITAARISRSSPTMSPSRPHLSASRRIWGGVFPGYKVPQGMPS